MSILRKVNLVLGLIGMGLCITHFFIKGVQVPLYVSFAYLSIIFLIWGIQRIKDKQLKSGYFYIVVAVFMSMSLIW